MMMQERARKEENSVQLKLTRLQTHIWVPSDLKEMKRFPRRSGKASTPCISLFHVVRL